MAVGVGLSLQANGEGPEVTSLELERLKDRSSLELEHMHLASCILMHAPKNHPRPPTFLDEEQLQSLTEKLSFLQDFLEIYHPHEDNRVADALESRIADAIYAAEDIIETHIVDQIQASSTSSTHGAKFSLSNLFQGLRKATSHGENMIRSLDDVIQGLDLIKRHVMEITNKTTKILDDDHQPHKNYSTGSLIISHSAMGQNTAFGFDDVLIRVMDKLTRHRSNRLIIPIVGMGGIGKTTLAKNIYVNPLIVHYFDFRGWATISQEYSIQQILLEVVLCLETKGNSQSLSQMSEYELGDKLYKSLFGRRYLIVMDDIWSIEAWDKVKTFFPRNNDGSALILTTRLSNLAFQLSDSDDFVKMSFLGEDKSWDLFCKCVFGEESCPRELEDVGKMIAKNCKGLPLSIVVIGRLLAKSKRTREHWQYIVENLNSTVNLEEDERCLRILLLSYNQLPVHLKPCFLYMGMFPEDHKIFVSDLIKLWVAEGFLKPISGKCLEVAAKEYLEDLIDRNLILVDELGSAGNIRSCTIHDLLRDLCIKEAGKDKFFHVPETQIGKSWQIARRIGIFGSISERNYIPQVLCRALKSVSLGLCFKPMLLTRSLIGTIDGVVVALPFRLLRIFHVADESGSLRRCGKYSPEKAFHLVNLRHLAIRAEVPKHFPSSPYQLWNLQTLVVDNSDWISVGTSPLFDIWNMPLLRHVKISHIELPDSPTKEDGSVVLENLQTLKTVRKFKCGEEVVKRIPNIKKLGLEYVGINFEKNVEYSLNNLCRLRKLESLNCYINVQKDQRSEIMQNLGFPLSLKKLTLECTHLHWEEMTTKIGSLPHLQVLKLQSNSCIGDKWVTVEGHFCSLKYLMISYCNNLEYWRTDSTHFPRLERLALSYLEKLKEIPSEIGDIPTLKSIELVFCSDSANTSAKTILQEQKDIGNEDLQVTILDEVTILDDDDEE